MLTDYERMFCSRCRKQYPDEPGKWLLRNGAEQWCAPHRQEYQRERYRARKEYVSTLSDKVPNYPDSFPEDDIRVFCAKCRKTRPRDEWEIKARTGIYCVEHRREMNRIAHGRGEHANESYDERLPDFALGGLADTDTFTAEDRAKYFEAHPDQFDTFYKEYPNLRPRS